MNRNALRPRVWALGVGLLIALFPASETQAQGSIRAAREAFVEGQEHYAAGEFAEAAYAFRRCFQESLLPEAAYNAFTAFRAAGQDGEALVSLQRYVEKPSPTRPTARRRARCSSG